jgi:hypothetical protein
MLKDKSSNFDRNLNSKKMNQQIDKNGYKVINLIGTTSKQKFIPIATRTTFNSVKIEKSSKGYKISSINYQNVGRSGIDRYNYEKPNGEYKTKSGNIIPAGKNSGRFKWFYKARQSEKAKINKISKEGVIE